MEIAVEVQSEKDRAISDALRWGISQNDFFKTQRGRKLFQKVVCLSLLGYQRKAIPRMVGVNPHKVVSLSCQLMCDDMQIDRVPMLPWVMAVLPKTAEIIFKI